MARPEKSSGPGLKSFGSGSGPLTSGPKNFLVKKNYIFFLILNGVKRSERIGSHKGRTHSAFANCGATADSGLRGMSSSLSHDDQGFSTLCCNVTLSVSNTQCVLIELRPRNSSARFYPAFNEYCKFSKNLR